MVKSLKKTLQRKNRCTFVVFSLYFDMKNDMDPNLVI